LQKLLRNNTLFLQEKRGNMRRRRKRFLFRADFPLLKQSNPKIFLQGLFGNNSLYLRGQNLLGGFLLSFVQTNRDRLVLFLLHRKTFRLLDLFRLELLLFGTQTLHAETG